jgi:Cft2 family RNA processing exonuclease
MAMNLSWSNGVLMTTEEVVVRFDPQTKNNLNSLNFFSHSHQDHIGGLNIKAENHMTFGTKDILFFRENNGSDRFKSLNYGEITRVGDLEIIAHNAGHILGSAQFEVRSPNTTVVYTGDINFRDMLTTQAAAVIPCDVLILETTYGSPNYVFPSFGETCMEIVNWTLGCLTDGDLPIFVVYSTGKAQEIIKIFNDLTKIPVLVHPTVAKVNQAYEKNGVKLMYTNSSSEEGREMLMSKQCVFVVPPQYKSFPPQSYSLATATGWVLKYRSNKFSGAFPLSGHADFRQLVDYVEQVKPKQVFTVHGNREYFAKHLSRKFGLIARSITPFKQKPLQAYL